MHDRKLVIVPREAETVRHIFRRYLGLGAVSALRDDLKRQAITSKLRTDRNGKTTGGKPFARGALYHMLKNRLYLGEIVHKGSSYPGEHAPIVDQTLWDAVAKQLEDNSHDHKTAAKAQEPSLLTGLIFDAAGCRLTPSHALKAGKRYRYYVSNTLVTGTRAASPNGRRLPASDIEGLVLNTIGDFFKSGQSVLDAWSGADFKKLSKEQALTSAATLADNWPRLPSGSRRILIRKLVRRVVIQAEHVDVEINRHQVGEILLHPDVLESSPEHGHTESSFVIKVNATLKRAGQGKRLVVRDLPANALNTTLVNLFVKAFDIRHKVLNGNGESIEAVSRRIKTNANYITALLRLSFLTPDIVAAVLDGSQPLTLTAKNFITKTHTLPREWSLQRRHLGF